MLTTPACISGFRSYDLCKKPDTSTALSSHPWEDAGRRTLSLLPNQVSQTGELQTNEGLIFKHNINIAVEKGSNQ